MVVAAVAVVTEGGEEIGTGRAAEGAEAVAEEEVIRSTAGEEEAVGEVGRERGRVLEWC